MSNQIVQAARVHLQTISGANSLQKEIGTKAYILDRLFGAQYPLTHTFTTKLIPFIDNNFESFERQVKSTAVCTTFSYDVSLVKVSYYNNCIRSTSNEAFDGLGAITPLSFQLLVDELYWG